MKTIADNPTPAAPTDGQTGGGEDFPPLKVDGRSADGLSRRVALRDHIAKASSPLKTRALQSEFAGRYNVSPRVIRDDLLVLRSEPAWRFWKVGRPGSQFELVWLRAKRDSALGNVIHQYGGDAA